MDFIISTDLATVRGQKIETNFEEVKAWLADQLAPYSTLVVTEDAISDAKKKLADIRRVKDSINQQKIAVKKEWMTPYTEYENQSKELQALCDDAVNNISSQVKEFEEKKKQEKIDRIKSVFEHSVGDMSAFLTWDNVFDPRFGNASYKEEKAYEDVGERILQTRRDIEMIRDLNSPYEAALLEDYSEYHDIYRSMEKNKTLLRIAEEAEARRKKEQEAQETVPETEPEAPVSEIPQQPQFIRPSVEEVPEEPVYVMRFELTMTKNQAFALRKFFNEQKIGYKKL